MTSVDLPTVRRARATLQMLRIDRAPSKKPLLRTARIGLHVASGSAEARALETIFDAAAALRRDVLADLDRRRQEKGIEAIAAMDGSPPRPEARARVLAATLMNRYVKDRDFVDPMNPAIARWMVVSPLAGNLVSYMTRRENVSKEIRKKVAEGRKAYEALVEAARAAGESKFPDAPPETFDETEAGIEAWNRWASQVRIWRNLLHVQKLNLDRDEAPQVPRLKGWPGFPGSAKRERPTAAEAVGLLDRLRGEARRLWAENRPAFDSLTPEEAEAFRERWAPWERETEKRLRPRSVRLQTCQVIGHRLAAGASTPEAAAALADEADRRAGRLIDHVRASGFDRQAIRVAADWLRRWTVLALEPLRLRGDFVALAAADEALKKVYGDIRGLLFEAGEESEALTIQGFSTKPKGGAGRPSYNALLAVRPRRDGEEGSRERWAILLQPRTTLMKTAAPDDPPPRGYEASDWVGFVTPQKEAPAEARPVFFKRGAAPLVLPLLFGKRLGREYLWNATHDIRRGGMRLHNGRILRIRDGGRTSFFATLTFSRAAHALVKAEAAPEAFVGVDRGEAVPAAYAVVDARGRKLARGKIAESYREIQRRFQDEKAEAQRRTGQYGRALRKKERHIAEALGGRVAREVLALCARHRAAVVFEALDSGVATRGGRKTFMSAMQYTRVHASIVARLAEAGLADERSTGRSNRFVLQVNPHHTSQTCSRCGTVHDSAFYEALASKVQRTNGGYATALPDGRPIALPETYRSRNPRTRKMTDQETAERIEAVFKDETWENLPKTRRAALISIVKNALPWRPDQARFRCLACGHEDEADVQAALNIARKRLFEATMPKGATTDRRRKAWEAWEAWYKCRIAEGWA